MLGFQLSTFNIFLNGYRLSTITQTLVELIQKVSTKGTHSVLKEGKKLGRWKAIIGFPVSFPSALIKR